MSDSFDHEVECCKRLINAIKGDNYDIDIHLFRRKSKYHVTMTSCGTGKNYYGDSDFSYRGAVVDIQGKLCALIQERLSGFNDALLFSGWKLETKAKLTE